MRAATGDGKRKLALAALALASITTLQGNAEPVSFEDRLLLAHNVERAKVGVPALQWNRGLAGDAAQWAQHLVRLGTLVHSPDEPRDDDPEGENLWAGTRGYYSPEAMVGLWAAERRHFKQGAFPNNSRTGDWDDIGHYTQLVWRSTHQVGCAVAHGPADDFLVCRYAEGGNVIGERPY